MPTRFELRPNTSKVQTIEYHHDEGPLSYQYTLPIEEISERHQRLLHPSVARLIRLEPAEVRECLREDWAQIKHPEVREVRDLLLNWTPGSILLTDPETWVVEKEEIRPAEEKVDIQEELEELINQVEAHRNPEGYEERILERRRKLDEKRLRQIREAEELGKSVGYGDGTSWLVFTRPDGGKAVSLPLSMLPIRLPDVAPDFDNDRVLAEFFHYFGGLAEEMPPFRGFATMPVTESVSDGTIGLRIFSRGDGDTFATRGKGEMGIIDYELENFGTVTVFRPAFDSFGDFINVYVAYLDKGAADAWF